MRAPSPSAHAETITPPVQTTPHPAPAPTPPFSLASLPVPNVVDDGGDAEDERDPAQEAEAPRALPAESSEIAAEPAEVTDRWEGTLSREWNDSGTSTASEPVRPVRLMNLAEAAALIPPESAAYLRSRLKTEVARVREYRPSRISRENPTGLGMS